MIRAPNPFELFSACIFFGFVLFESEYVLAAEPGAVHIVLFFSVGKFVDLLEDLGSIGIPFVLGRVGICPTIFGFIACSFLQIVHVSFFMSCCVSPFPQPFPLGGNFFFKSARQWGQGPRVALWVVVLRQADQVQAGH